MTDPTEKMIEWEKLRAEIMNEEQEWEKLTTNVSDMEIFKIRVRVERSTNSQELIDVLIDKLQKLEEIWEFDVSISLSNIEIIVLVKSIDIIDAVDYLRNRVLVGLFSGLQLKYQSIEVSSDPYENDLSFLR